MRAEILVLGFGAGPAEREHQFPVARVAEDWMEELSRRGHCAFDQAEIRGAPPRNDRFEVFSDNFRVPLRKFAVFQNPGVEAKVKKYFLVHSSRK